MARQRGEFVRRGDKWQPGQRGDFCGDRLAKTMGRVQAGAHRRTALCQFVDGGQGTANGALGVVQLRDKRRDLLAEGDGVASIIWVRPVLTSFIWRADNSARPPDSSRSAGSNCSCTACTVAMLMAVGKQSLELWERLT